MKSAHFWCLLSASLLIPILLFVYFTFLSPRPFYVLEDDAESPNYYSARLICAGERPFYISHPGTPIYYLDSLIMVVSNSRPKVVSSFRPEAVKRFFSLSHFVVSLLAAASLCGFVWTFLKNIPIGISALTLASIVAWPTFLTYLDYLETNSFIVPFGLLSVSLFWSNLEKGQIPNRIKLLLCGLGLGLCLATKVSFAPVAIALFAGCSSQVWRSWGTKSGQWTSLLILPMGAAVSFLVLTVPIFGRLPYLVLITLGRESIFPESSSVLGSFLKTFGRFLEVNFPLAVLIMVPAVVFLYLLSSYFYGKIRDFRTQTTNCALPEKRFDYVSGGVFISLMLLAFAYTMACTRIDGDPGIALRNVAPSALALPFLVLYCFRLYSAYRSPSAVQGTRIQVALVVVALLIVAISVGRRLDVRREFMDGRSPLIAQTVDRLEELRAPGTRVAFFDDSHDTFIGEVSFHFTGNNAYANDYFDKMLLEQYPRYTLFRLGEIPRLIRQIAHEKDHSTNMSTSELQPRGSRFGTAGIKWRKLFPDPFPRRTDELFAGEMAGIRVSLIAFPEYELKRLEGIPQTEFLSLIQDRIGTPTLWKESIGGINWVLIAVTGEGKQRTTGESSIVGRIYHSVDRVDK